PSAQADCACARMEAGAAEAEGGSSGADVGQRAAFAMAVEVHRQPQVVPEALTELVRQIAAGVQGGLTEGHDRNHVRGADPRVDALMPAQVDLLDGPGDRSKQPLDQSGSRTGDR